MDFLTALPYWGIVVIIILNAWLVSKMEIVVDDPEQKTPDQGETQPVKDD